MRITANFDAGNIDVIDLENKAEGGVLIQLTLPVEATFISQLKNE